MPKSKPLKKENFKCPPPGCPFRSELDSPQNRSDEGATLCNHDGAREVGAQLRFYARRRLDDNHRQGQRHSAALFPSELLPPLP